MSWSVIEGDCVEAMRAMDEASVDAVVTDPPYGLEFMGKDWDAPWKGDGNTGATIRDPATERGGFQDGNGGNPYSRSRIEYGRGNKGESRAFQAWCGAWAVEALRVLKPGGHLLAFGGARTYHRLACAIEDAGFEIRDCIAWLYGSGFPKSLDVSKAIDAQAGAVREPDDYTGANGLNAVYGNNMGGGHTLSRGAPATPDAERWQGWGTALKPAHEPVVVARKPLAGTVAATVLEHGTGALNIDATRIDTGGEELSTPQSDPAKRAGVVGTDLGITGAEADRFQQAQRESIERTNALGRWPANVVLDPDAAAMLDEQTGDLPAGVAVNRNREPGTMTSWLGTRASQTGDDVGYGDSGGASRFFYCAKASSAERNAGLDGFEAAITDDGRNVSIDNPYLRGETTRRNVHPTVKPIDLMRWLVRLVTPPNGTVLDPFCGSGTTGCAAVLEGFRFLGIEREPEYAAIARARLAWWAKRGQVSTEAALRAGLGEDVIAASGQSAFDLLGGAA